MKPLDDVRVVAIDSWMAVPSAAAIMSDLGADVIKIEPLTGDPMRGNSRAPKIDDGPAREYDYQFDVSNRGKRSVAVDLNDPRGVEIVHRLVEGADVFMCNLLPRRQARFSLDAESLGAINPTLVHATLTGYGSIGPDAERSGYDVTAFFGRSGLTQVMADGPEGVPPNPAAAQGDHVTGLALLGGILAAMRLAERTGEVQVVETSLFEAAVWTQATNFSVTAQDEKPLRPRARNQAISATMSRYCCADGRWLVINMPLPRDFARLAELIGCGDMVDDERFADFRGRFRNMAEITERWDEAFATKTRDEWGNILDDAGIVWGAIAGYDEVVRDPQAEALGLFPSVDSGAFGDYRTVANPIRIAGVELDPVAPAPGIGQHSVDVLGEAGFDQASIDGLLADGIVASASPE
ncbi:MAG: CoA transferase [Actinomycetota bacterium]